jgi:hypothetical protein
LRAGRTVDEDAGVAQAGRPMMEEEKGSEIRNVAAKKGQKFF